MVYEVKNIIENIEKGRLAALSIMKAIENSETNVDAENIYEDIEEAIDGLNIAQKCLGEALLKAIQSSVRS